MNPHRENAICQDMPGTSKYVTNIAIDTGVREDKGHRLHHACVLCNVLNKRWAVVPCCVFPQSYPTRADPLGGVAPVRTTDALVRHLMARAPGETGACELRCEGAKTAVTLPKPGLPTSTRSKLRAT